MKNAAFEFRRNRPWKPTGTGTLKVTRARLVRALSGPQRPRREVMAIVAQYMGDSPVPPGWSRRGVRGFFGRQIERLWSRHICALRPATYRESGRVLTPIVQTTYDFGLTPQEWRDMATSLAVPPVPKHEAPPVFLDEFHTFGDARKAMAA